MCSGKSKNVLNGNIGLELTGKFEVIEIVLRLKIIELVVKALREYKKLIIKT